MSELSLKVYHVVIEEKDKPPREYFFTTEDAPVTYKGRQYVPINQADAERWGLLGQEDVGAKE